MSENKQGKPVRLKKRKRLAIFYTAPIVLAFLFLCGCASSDISRNAASQVDDVYDSASGIGKGADPMGSFQTAKQATKGGIIGGATGAVAGSFINGVGTVPGAIGGAIFGAALGAYIDQHTTWRDKLENGGGRIIVLGDQVKIVIPSSLLFHSMTTTLNSSAYSLLDLVAEYLRSFSKISVKVAAFTNNTGTERINQTLSQEQANSVARYLWKAGVNARLMTATGYGGTHLVTQNTFDWNQGDNYRVEITAEKL